MFKLNDGRGLRGVSHVQGDGRGVRSVSHVNLDDKGGAGRQPCPR